MEKLEKLTFQEEKRRIFLGFLLTELDKTRHSVYKYNRHLKRDRFSAAAESIESRSEEIRGGIHS